MSTCQGCGYTFADTREVFGAVGQAFCFDCFCADAGMADERESLRRERRDLEKELAAVEKEMDAIESPLYFHEEYGGMQKAAVQMSLDHKRAGIWFRLEDVKEELACLTVQYQRRFSVIGRAAA